MKALIILAHGSKNENSNIEVVKLAQSIGSISAKDFSFIECAFLQFAEPAVDKVIQTLIEHGVIKILIFPFFMAAGNHVTKDIPKLIGKFNEEYPEVEFIITKHLGGIDKIADLIKTEAAKY